MVYWYVCAHLARALVRPSTDELATAVQRCRVTSVHKWQPALANSGMRWQAKRPLCATRIVVIVLGVIVTVLIVLV